MKTYPAMRWMAMHGRKLAPAVAVLIVISGIYGYIRTAIPEFAVGGVLLGLASFGILRVVTELIEVLTEMLLPS